MDTAILHLAPVARETPREWRGRADFVGLTPQGLLRRWDAAGEIALVPPPPGLIPERCDALVLSAAERGSCAELLRRAHAGGAILAVTAGAQPTELHLPDGERLRIPVPPLERPPTTSARATSSPPPSSSPCTRASAPGEAAAFAHAAAAVRLGGIGPAAIGGRAAIEARLAREHGAK